MSFSKDMCILDVFHKSHSLLDGPYQRESLDNSTVFVIRELMHLQREGARYFLIMIQSHRCESGRLMNGGNETCEYPTHDNRVTASISMLIILSRTVLQRVHLINFLIITSYFTTYDKYGRNS